MWSPETLVVLNKEFEEKINRDTAKRERLGEAKFEEARLLDTRNKD